MTKEPNEKDCDFKVAGRPDKMLIFGSNRKLDSQFKKEFCYLSLESQEYVDLLVSVEFNMRHMRNIQGRKRLERKDSTEISDPFKKLCKQWQTSDAEKKIKKFVGEKRLIDLIEA